MRKLSVSLVAPLAAALCSFPVSAYAYLGPGAGISAVGSVLAVVFALFAAIVGFVWYPVKRIFRKKRPSDAQQNDTDRAGR